MSHDRKAVDALLATAVSQNMGASCTLNLLRELHRQGNDQEFWRAVMELAQQLNGFKVAWDEIHRLMLPELLARAATKEGGLPN